MPSQDWYRPGKNYLRRDSAKFRYTKRNAKLVPPFGCSQKLGYCDLDSDNKPDRILKQYRSPALKKGYGCHPFDGPLFLGSFLRIPNVGPSIFEVNKSEPKSGPSSFFINVIRPALPASSFEAEVLAPVFTNNLFVFAKVLPPKIGISTVSAEVLLPEFTESLGVSAEVVVPRSVPHDILVEVIIPTSGVSAVSSELLVPELTESLDVSAKVVVPELGSHNISAEVIIPTSGVSAVSSELLVPELTESLGVSAKVVVPELGSRDISAEVLIPTSGVSPLSVEVVVPESGSHSVSTEVLIPELGSHDISAEVLIPTSTVSTVSAQVLLPELTGSLNVSAEVLVPKAATIELSAKVVIPGSGISNVSAEVLPPTLNGPSSLNLLLVLPPTSSISDLETAVKVPELSTTLDLSANVLVSSSSVTNLSTEVQPPAQGVSSLDSFVVPVPGAGSAVLGLETSVKAPELSTPLDLSAKVLVSNSSVNNLSAEVQHAAQSVTNLTAAVIPWPSTASNVSDLEITVKAPELSTPLGLSANVLAPSSLINSLSTEVQLPVESVSDLAAAIIPWPSTTSNVSDLVTVVKAPELSGPLDLSASVSVSNLSVNSLSTEVEPPVQSITGLVAFVKAPTFGPSDLFIDYTNQNLVLSAPKQTASFNQVIAVSSGGVFIIPFNVGSSASTFKFHLNAFGSPDRFQLLYDSSGLSNLLSDADIVADSLFVGDNLNSTNPSNGTLSLTAYVYVGTGGDSFSSTFNNVGSETITIAPSDRAPLTGFRTTSAPNGTGQTGVQNEVYTSSTGTSLGLPYSDGNICLTLTKPTSTNTIAYLKIYAPSTASGSSVVKIESI